MNTFSNNQLVGLVLIGVAMIDVYILPKILLKKYDQDSQSALIPQQKAELEKKKKTMKLIIAITISVPVILGILFFLGIIPIDDN